jgi:uncharacterized Rossmann fold enzyme
MRLEEWWCWYEEIVRAFGFSIEEDQKAADLLSSLIERRAMGLANLRREIKGRPVIVFGAGPSLVRNLQEIRCVITRSEWCIASADGATTTLMEADVTPDYVVTDLDGRVGDILEAQRVGALIIIHAHGDNIQALRSYVPLFQGRVIGTTQAQPRRNVYNFGGFTDGDRCVFLAEEFGAVLVVLAGMDLGSVVGKYSKPYLQADLVAEEVKRKKHWIARRLLSWLSECSSVKILNVTGSGEKIEGLRDIQYGDLTNWRSLIS